MKFGHFRGAWRIPFFCLVFLAIRGHAAEVVVRPDGSSPTDYVPLSSVREIPINISANSKSVAANEADVAELSAISHGAAVRITPPSSVIDEVLPPLGIPKTILPKRFPGPIHRHPFLPLTPITSCGQITVPGHYFVTQDLVSDDSCLTIINTQNVMVTCLGTGHSIASTLENSNDIQVVNSKEVTISGCTLPTPRELNNTGISIFNSSDVRLLHNTMQNVYVTGSTGTFVSGNQIIGGYTQTDSSWTSFVHNVIKDYSDIVTGAGIWSQNGAYNQFIDNQIDGGWKGVYNPNLSLEQGADDGVILFYEHNDSVENNAIKNVWDAGFESVGLLSNTLIENNQITNVYYTGIGAYYDTGWKNVTIKNNHVSNSLDFIQVNFSTTSAYGEPPPSTLYFVNNSIEGNTFDSPGNFGGMPYFNSMIILAYDDDGIPSVAANNRVTGNILPTTMAGPSLLPSSAFVDGGGNICGVEPAGSPIACSP